jgi:hypothetical protein
MDAEIDEERGACELESHERRLEPAETPSAVRIPARRPPSSELRIVSAVSCPGVTMTTIEMAANAASISARPELHAWAL